MLSVIRELAEEAEARAQQGPALGDLLVELGYEPDDAWVGARTHPTLATRVRHRLANSSARALRSLADRVEQLPLRR